MNKRIEVIRSLLEKQSIDAILLTNKTNRIYVSGFTGTDACIYISQKQAYIITDFRYFEQIKSQAPNFVVVDIKGNMPKKIVETIIEDGAKNIAIEQQDMAVSMYLKLQQYLEQTPTKLIPFDNFVEKLRMIKNEKELGLLEAAAKIADDAYLYILETIQVGMKEQEVAFLIDQYVRSHGASDIAFETIVASGIRSALPHGHASSKIIEKHDIVTIDFGAVYQGYYSDMTRTFGMGTVSLELQEIYAIVLAAQEKGVALAMPGMKASEVDALCRNYIEVAGFGEYFGHGTGHGVGLTCHEFPSLNQIEQQIVKQNMCVTIEPGIYLPRRGGVRIEDTIVLKDTGAIRLTKSTKEWIEV